MTPLPIEHMTTEEKLEAMELIWRDLCRVPGNVVSPSWHADVLNARKARIHEDQARFVDWDQAKQSLLEDPPK